MGDPFFDESEIFTNAPDPEDVLRLVRDKDLKYVEEVAVQELVIRRSFTTNHIAETTTRFNKQAAEMFTEEEHQDLCLSLGRGTKVMKVNNHAPTITEWRDITLTVENIGLTEMLFVTLPFEELPLHIGAKKERIAQIVKWRLDRGK